MSGSNRQMCFLVPFCIMYLLLISNFLFPLYPFFIINNKHILYIRNKLKQCNITKKLQSKGEETSLFDVKKNHYEKFSSWATILTNFALTLQ